MTSTDIAPAGQQHVTAKRGLPKTLRLSKPLRQAIRLLSTGECKTQKAAAERVGLTEQHLSKMMNRADIGAYAAQQARENISRGVLRASARFVELIDAESEHVAAKVSERFLEHGGIIKPQTGNSVNVSINNNLQTGYVYDLHPAGNNPSPADHPQVIDNAQVERK